MLEMFVLIFNLFISLLLFWAGYLSFRSVVDKEFAKNPPFLPSFGKEKETILAEVSKLLETKPHLKVVDPGCGMGALLISLAKKFPNHEFTGIELSFPVFVACKLRCWRLKNVKIIKSNLFDVPFKDFDVIVCFLYPTLMQRFSEKIKNECKKEISIFSNSFKIDGLPVVKEFETKKKSFVQNVYQHSLEP